MNSPKVSVIMPSLNVANYIKECIESVIQQTLEDIEIICVDAGSTDGTWEILQEYASQDQRIKLIHSDRKSYGYQMNLGLDASTGEYIGIVETDDWVEKDMFEQLWKTAVTNNVDIVKSNYYWYKTKSTPHNQKFENLSRCPYDTVFLPIEEKKIFTTTPAIWSGIYRKKLLCDNNIRFNETAGASYQDTSFHFMVLTVASTCMLVNSYFLHYRRDNEGSSVNTDAKVYCICDEMHYYEKFLQEHPEKKSFWPYYITLKYEKYRWNFARISPQAQWPFLKLMYDEFFQAKQAGLLEKNLFLTTAWSNLCEIIDNPVRYFEKNCKTYYARFGLPDEYTPKIITKSKCAKPEVSVIIPCYNCQKYIVETLESVLTQTLSNLEIVCVNDGSTDNTLDILLEYANKDSRISVVSQVNKGQSSARNIALTLAKGKYIHFLDSDDLLKSNTMKDLYTTAEERNLDVLYFDGESFYESPELEKQFPYYISAYEYSKDTPDILTGQQLFVRMKRDRKYRASPCLCLYKRQYLLDFDLKFLEGILHEDTVFSLKCMLQAKRVAHTKEKYLLRRVHTDSIMTMPKSFLHLYGYLISFTELQTFVAGLPYESELNKNVASELNIILNLACKTYKDIQNKQECRGKLTPIELIFLERILLSEEKTFKVISTNNEAELIRASASYKIGRFFTWPARMVRGLVRCIEDNGWKYTWLRILQKLKIN